MKWSECCPSGVRSAAPKTRAFGVDRIVCDDNLVYMSSLPDGCCDLIYADPPFNSNRTVGPTKRHGATFNDRHGEGVCGFLDFLKPRVMEMHRLLSPTGCLYVHLDWRTVHYVKVLLDEVFGQDHFLNEIIWSYRSGGVAKRWFARKHDTLLFYAKKVGVHTFNRMRHGEYRTLDLRMSADGRPFKQTRNGRLYFHPDGPAIPDVWDIPFLSTVSKERVGYPTQKPESLLERVILASSNEGDVVADFFCGSGTTLAVAARLERRWLGCDLNPDAVAITQRRLDEVARVGQLF